MAENHFFLAPKCVNHMFTGLGKRFLFVFGPVNMLDIFGHPISSLSADTPELPIEAPCRHLTPWRYTRD